MVVVLPLFVTLSKSVHYNSPKKCPRKIIQEKKNYGGQKMSTRVREKCPRKFILWKFPLEFTHFEKSVHENSPFHQARPVNNIQNFSINNFWLRFEILPDFRKTRFSSKNVWLEILQLCNCFWCLSGLACWNSFLNLLRAFWKKKILF